MIVVESIAWMIHTLLGGAGLTMFLFTTPSETAAAPSQRNPIAEAVHYGAQRTGADFGYLMRTAERESSLNPTAKAPTSSATGLFQFVDQTWLMMVKQEGPRHGLQAEADLIAQRADGRYVVTDPSRRDEIMALRNDPKTSAVMAGAFTQRNNEVLRQTLGREPNDGEKYMAHFLGARGASEFLRRADANPDRSAAAFFPDEASANRRIFYERDGKARSFAQVKAVLATGFSRDAAVDLAAADPQSGKAAWLGAMPVVSNKSTRNLTDSLFRTDGITAPVSAAVKRNWATPRVASLDPLSRFFPTSDGIVAAPPGETSTHPTAGEANDLPATAPLPPSRPGNSPAGRENNIAAARYPGLSSRSSKPMDLSALMMKAGRS